MLAVRGFVGRVRGARREAGGVGGASLRGVAGGGGAAFVIVAAAAELAASPLVDSQGRARLLLLARRGGLARVARVRSGAGGADSRARGVVGGGYDALDVAAAAAELTHTNASTVCAWAP
jgi:hypothetical protein